MKKAALLAVVAFMGCGDDDQRAEAPAQVTPVPTAEAPVPTPEDELHEEPGDEAGTRVPVTIELATDAIAVQPPVVAAFLPLGLTIRNTADEDATVAVRRDGRLLARLEVPAGERATADVPGLERGEIEIRSPGRAPAVLRVEPGGG